MHPIALLYIILAAGFAGFLTCALCRAAKLNSLREALRDARTTAGRWRSKALAAEMRLADVERELDALRRLRLSVLGCAGEVTGEDDLTQGIREKGRAIRVTHGNTPPAQAGLEQTAVSAQ